jgi:hypothetical protein
MQLGKLQTVPYVDSNLAPVRPAYNLYFSACFFNRNSVFLSQQISQQYFSIGLSAQPNENLVFRPEAELPIRQGGAAASPIAGGKPLVLLSSSSSAMVERRRRVEQRGVRRSASGGADVNLFLERAQDAIAKAKGPT